ncbi:MAG: hypothetical protein DDT21_01847 [Syntrophomonadaceae bacterium]|nr:hypothetical protein [Bacillota bacterium]
MNETRYQVVRPFSGLDIGTVLPGDTMTARRAQQLTEQRYILPLVGGSDYQPSVSLLLASSIRELRLLISEVKDACLLHTALKTEERQVARSILEKRLKELEGTNAEYTQ